MWWFMGVHVCAVLQCGGCWAFSCVEILESAAVHSGQPLRALSEQQVLDCSRRNYGCSGGHVLLALKWLNQVNHHDPHVAISASISHVDVTPPTLNIVLNTLYIIYGQSKV